MKFIHTSDLHLDSKIEGLSTEKSKLRREELLRTFERLVEYAKANNVRAIIIAGDMFDTPKVTAKTKDRIVECIKKHSDIDFLYLSGNHDQISFINIENFPNNLITFDDKWKSVKYENCVITGVQLNSINKKTIYDDLKLNEDDINIVVMHGQIAGYKSKDDAELISIPLLKEKNIDYLALGHIHSFSKGEIDTRGTYTYSGCLDGRGFDELGQKGFVLLNCEISRVESTFVPFSSRNLYEFEFNVEKYNSFYELIDNVISTLQVKIDRKSLVKVILKGQHKLDFYIDKFSIEKRLNEEFFFAKVYDKTELEISSNDFEFDKSIKGEFVRTVWESDLTIEEKNKIIMCGLSALKGEDI